ncbi:MAG: immunity 51 family protein [Pirellula sp.]|nr:immunity 51 family protein [Pirellula sp.]
MANPNPYFPCEIVEQGDDYSIICSNFYLFKEHFGDKEVGGYSIERLAKRLAREHRIKGINFDSEAGMFCAYATEKEPLERLCEQLRDFTGGEELHVSQQQEGNPPIPLAEAEELLINGFVKSLDKLTQERFLRLVPFPPLSKVQSDCLRQVQEGTDAEKIKAAKKINSEARTSARDWDNYLSHPSTITLLLDSCDAHPQSSSVYLELVWVLVFICGRHLPDLRTGPYFVAALEDKRQQMRWLGIMGLYSLCILSSDHLKPLLMDKSSKVKETAKEHLRWLEDGKMQFPSWMFQSLNR